MQENAHTDSCHEEQEEECHAQGKHSRQQMHQFQTRRILLVEIDAGYAAVVHLTEELTQVRATLVPYPCLRKETAGSSALYDTDTQIDILSKPHLGKSAKPAIETCQYSHIEGSGIEAVQFLASPTYSTCGEETGHAVADGLLYGCKGGMRTVWSAKSIALILAQLPLHSLQILRRQHAIAVQKDQVLSLRALSTIVARLSRSTVRLTEIFDGHLGSMSLHHLLAGNLGPIFHNKHFKVTESLLRKAFKQFVRFIWPVVHRYDKGVSHLFLLSS